MSEHVIWSPGVTLEAIERQVIIAAYAFYQRNKAATAQALGISVRTLDNKFEKYAADDAAAVAAVQRRRQAEADYLARSRGEKPVQVVASVLADMVGAPVTATAVSPGITVLTTPTAAPPPATRNVDDVIAQARGGARR